ncbi:hypothetical protein pipiens_013601 [Culex pipiens pipiens]|uniref:Uncharacterized protein n=1 Tax=Culex pipiens pipiens TaxID=38569 RepID=A0ABD1CXT1_CULPP
MGGPSSGAEQLSTLTNNMIDEEDWIEDIHTHANQQRTERVPGFRLPEVPCAQTRRRKHLRIEDKQPGKSGEEDQNQLSESQIWLRKPLLIRQSCQLAVLLLQGDSTNDWRTKKFWMFRGGSICKPPLINFYTQGMPEKLLVDLDGFDYNKGNLSAA